MIGIDQLIVALWFVPVVFFIILPLFISCFGVLYALFDVFKPIAGQAKKPIRRVSRSSEIAWRSGMHNVTR